MIQSRASHTVLFVSLFALTAATAVTGAALVSWNGAISQRLTLQTASSDAIADTIIIGGVDDANLYAYQTFAAPVVPYRAPDETLPSQRLEPFAEQMAATTANDGVAELLAEAANSPDEPPAVESDAPSSDIGAMDISSADALATQAAILDNMRQPHVPVKASF